MRSPPVLAALWLLSGAGCGRSGPATATVRPSAGVLADFPGSATPAAYTYDVPPGFRSPEAVNAYLERRWPLSRIRAACTDDHLASAMGQDLVLDEGQSWKGRLYEDRDTGFDSISWYASVHDGRLVAYSLYARRGRACWMLGGGGPRDD